MTNLIPILAPYIAPTLLQTMIEHPFLPDTPVAQRFPSAVIFADVSGFTPLTESLAQKGTEGPEELTRLLNSYFTRMIACIEEQGGAIAKFSGDALTVLFPVADGEPGHAVRRAFQAAMAMQDAMPEFARLQTSVGTATLGMKIAVGVGDVIAMQVGGVFDRWEYVVAGDPLRQVAEVESQTARGEIRLSAEAQALLYPDPLPPTPLIPPDWSTIANPLQLANCMRCYIPGSVVGWLQEGMQEWMAVLRPMSVLFMGIGGLNYDTNDDMNRLHNLVCAVQEIIYRYEGSLNKVVFDDKGTVVLLLFGAPPLAHEDDALRAVRCALEIQCAVREGVLDNLAGRVAIGVASGRVFAGPVGSDSRREYTVMGDTVNLAARLMGKAGAGGILCDLETYRHSHSRVAFETLDPMRLKGKAGLIRVYRPLEQSAGAALLDGSATPAQTSSATFVGRTAELARLEAALHNLQAGQGRTIIIEGEAGIGKSRLVQELVRLVREQGLTGLIGAGYSTERRTPYRAWYDIFTSFFDLEGLPDQARWQQRVLRVVYELAVDHIARVPLLSDVLKLDMPESDLTASLDPLLRQRNLTLLITALLQAWAHERPLIIILEDAHWLDSVSWELSVQVARALHAAGAPMLLVLVTRPVEEHSRVGNHIATLRAHEQTESIVLNELSPEETTALVAARLGLGADELPGPLADLVVQRAGGNPFFAEELIFTLREQGVVTITENDDAPGASSRCMLTGSLDVSTLALPDTVQGLVLARVDRLQPELQLTLKVGSVIGRLFPYTTLRHALGRHTSIDDQTLKGYLDLLVSLEMTPIDTPEPDLTYIFKHSITQEVVYQTLLFTQRRAIHRTVARWYEITYGEHHVHGNGNGNGNGPADKHGNGQASATDADSGSVPCAEAARVAAPTLAPYYPLLVHHYRYADDRECERSYARLAGERAAAQFANAEAIAYLNRALDLTLRCEYQERYDILLVREQVYSLQGEREAQHCDLIALEDLAEILQNNRYRIEVALRRANYGDLTGDFQAVIETAQYAIALAAIELDVGSEAEGHLLWGMALHAQGDYPAAQDQLELALTLTCIAQVHESETRNFTKARSRHLLNLEARSLLNIGNVAAEQGKLDEARACYQHSLRVCHEIGDRLGESKALGNLGVVAADQGDYAEARSYYEQDLHLCHEIGDRLGESVALNNLGSVASGQGDYAQARLFYQQSLELCREMDDPEGESFGLSGLCMLLHQVGDNEAALEHGEQAMNLTRETGDRNIMGDVLTSMGNALASLGRLDEAVKVYMQAFELRRELGQYSKADESLAGMARVALAQGEVERTSIHIEDILNNLEDGLPQGTYEPFRVYLTCYQVLQAQNDDRALPLLKMAHTLLQEQAARIGSDAMRHSFLNNVPAHRAIVEEVRQRFFFVSREVGDDVVAEEG